MAKLIYLSPSNHGKGANKCRKPGCYEDKHTRPIAEACAEHLKNNGFDVIVAKTAQNMAARCQEANSKKAVLYVPIHTNASGSESARYLMFMFYRDSDTYRELFNDVAPALEDIYPGKLRAKFAKRAELYEINRPNAKSLYCELGFHTNQKDADNFIHDSEAVGKALAKGICNYFGVTFKDGEEKPEEPEEPEKPDEPGRPQTPDEPEHKDYSKGASVKLSGAALYSTSAIKVPSTHVTGTYYLWDGKVINNRMRITNLKSRVGQKGQVTGWIKKDSI